MDQIIKDIADYLYRLFVVNPYAAAIQQDDGRYLTKYFPFSPFVIECMLNVKGAIGCYQQGFKNGLVKWICFDFDCSEKNNQDDLYRLNSDIISHLTDCLKMYNISYLTEFSGRRGIHVWILFSEVLPKETAYAIALKIISICNINALLGEKFELDLFPATSSAAGNKVGKQVKLPLSCHKSGGQSFFFSDSINFACIYEDCFYEEQLKFLKNYNLNSAKEVCDSLKIDPILSEFIGSKYKKFTLEKNILCSSDDVERILSSTAVYSKIFHRLNSGLALQRDWFVLLGTLGVIDTNGELLKAIFSKSPAYDYETTSINIEKWKSMYYPATFRYLYNIYDLTIEDNIDENLTGLEYLLQALQQEQHIDIQNLQIERTSEMNLLSNVKFTIEKERKYILYNDENVDISIWNELNNIYGYDIIHISQYIAQVENGDISFPMMKTWKKYIRKEAEDKERILVSLGAFDRVLTTHLALKLAYKVNNQFRSYSYNVLFISKTDIFYNWFTSWGNYLDQIRTFLEIPYLSDWGVIVLDLKKFYDSIDFLAVYNLIQDKLDDIDRNIFRFLVKFNEELMREISNVRIGVPQGPAYARIISEMFLSTIIHKLPGMVNGEYRLYRYVDDIVIFYSPLTDGEDLYKIIVNLMLVNGLDINKSKSREYGRIGSLTSSNKNKILRKDKFDYQLQISEINSLLENSDKSNLFSEKFSDVFNINDVAYIFGSRTDNFFIKRYFNKFKNSIFSEHMGRGSIFANFYHYLFRHKSLLSEALSHNCFSKIDIESVNFKNCISQLYLAIQNKELDILDYEEIREQFLVKIDLDKVSDDDRTTINSILYWGLYNAEC